MKKEIVITLLMFMSMGTVTVSAADCVPESDIATVSEETVITLPAAGDFLYQAIQDENLKNIDETLPVEIQFHIDQGGDGSTAILTEEKEIQKALVFFKKISVKAETNTCVTDNYNWVSFVYDNGEKSFISLNLENLELNANGTYHYYELNDLDGFWKYMSEYLVSDYEREQEEIKS